MSIIVYVISKNIPVVYRYPCRLLPLWYQRTYWLYRATHVNYCLCDLRVHTFCILLPMSIIVFVLSENILVVYRYPCRLLSLWYQRTYWLYIDTHVDYCLCDIREHTGCIELPMSIIVFVISEYIPFVYCYPCRLLSLCYQRTYWLYIDTRVDYCLCDIREHTGCI